MICVLLHIDYCSSAVRCNSDYQVHIMGCVTYVGWATNSHATVMIRLYVLKKKTKRGLSHTWSQERLSWDHHEATWMNHIEMLEDNNQDLWDKVWSYKFLVWRRRNLSRSSRDRLLSAEKPYPGFFGIDSYPIKYGIRNLISIYYQLEGSVLPELDSQEDKSDPMQSRDQTPNRISSEHSSSLRTVPINISCCPRYKIMLNLISEFTLFSILLKLSIKTVYYFADLEEGKSKGDTSPYLKLYQHKSTHPLW
jgi:hypothetical protein